MHVALVGVWRANRGLRRRSQARVSDPQLIARNWRAYRVTYDIGTGRPYAALEALTLKAVESGINSVQEISSSFRVHPRLVIESLITLIHAGWMVLGAGDDSGYVLTAAGVAALAESALPPSLQVIRDLEATVVMERVSGLVASGSEVDYQTQYQLKQRGLWEHCVAIRARFHTDRVDEGQIQHLLHRPEDHWLERVGPILQESKHTHWAPVTVDLDHRTVRLPTSRWSGSLSDHILQEVEASERSRDLASRRQVWFGRRSGMDASGLRRPGIDLWPAALEPGDVLTRGTSHRQYLRDALGGASGAVLISSAFITAAAIDDLETDLQAALDRDIDIDVLWGYDAEDGVAVDRLKKLAYDGRTAQGKLRFNRVRSGSHAKLLIWQEDGAVHAVVGSFNWLSARPADDEPASHPDELSVVLHEPGVVGAIARIAAGMWLESRSERLAAAPHYWRKLAAELESRGAVGNAVAGFPDTAKMIRDREHEGVLLAGVLDADSRLVVASHRLGSPAAVRLRGLARSAEGRRVEIRYGESSDQDALAVVESLCAELGAELRHLPRNHAKFVLAGDAAVVGSYNFLAADPYGTAQQSRELSIEIAGPGASLIWDAVAA